MSNIDFDKIKPGALKRQLRVPQDYKFKLKDLDKMAKTPNGESVMFEGKSFKMTPLLKRRVNFARNAKRFASKNKGKKNPKNPVSDDQIDFALQRLYPRTLDQSAYRVETVGDPQPIAQANRARDYMNRQFAQRNENATAFVNPEGRIVVAKILPDGPQINIRSNQVRQEILNTVDNMGMEP
jgi:hypothetical protein